MNDCNFRIKDQRRQNHKINQCASFYLPSKSFTIHVDFKVCSTIILNRQGLLNSILGLLTHKMHFKQQMLMVDSG
jgi:hypothetical protein